MRSVVNALRVLELVAENQPIGVSEVARLLGMPKTTAQRCLTALHEADWLTGGATEPVRWQLTPRAGRLARQAVPQSSMREASLPALMHLWRELDETVHLMVREGDRVLLLERIDTSKPVRTSNRLGMLAPMHAPSAGQALLAHLPEEEMLRIIGNGLERCTANTVTDPALLLEKLSQARRVGYATNCAEWRDEVFGLGAPVRDQGGYPVAAISVSMPMSRHKEHRIPEIGKMVCAAADQISENLAHAQPATSPTRQVGFRNHPGGSEDTGEHAVEADQGQ